MTERLREQTVTFTSDGNSLAGSLVLPTADRPVAAVLLLPGSGETDRNDNARALAINAFPPIVQALGEIGLASFRYDKRGVGDSGGDYWGSGFNDRLTDAVAAVDWLRAQPQVDPAQIFVLGHSEGALLAVRMAAGAAPIAGLVLLAGSAKTGEETMLWQGRQIADSITGFPRLIIKSLRIDPLASQRKAIARIKASTSDTLRVQLVRKLNAKWLREFMAYDPAPDLAKVHVSVLAITGSKDLQVDPADLQTMAQLIPGQFESYLVPDVTHLLRHETGASSLQTYKKQARRPVDGSVIDRVCTWLKEQTNGTNQ